MYLNIYSTNNKQSTRTDFFLQLNASTIFCLTHIHPTTEDNNNAQLAFLSDAYLCVTASRHLIPPKRHLINRPKDYSSFRTPFNVHHENAPFLLRHFPFRQLSLMKFFIKRKINGTFLLRFTRTLSFFRS